MAFIHPKPADHDYWLFQQARYSAWYRTIAVDLPGYGKSPGAPGDFDMADVADAVWAALESAQVESAILVGVSIGSTVAQHMAGRQPDRTLALALTAGGYFGLDDARFRSVIRRSIDEYGAQEPGAVTRRVMECFSPAFRQEPVARYVASIYEERAAHLDVPTILRLYELLLTPVPDAVHRAIVSPTIVITGNQDPGHLAHLDLARRLRADVAIISGAGHYCNLEQPLEYDRHLLDFLARHDLGSVSPA